MRKVYKHSSVLVILLLSLTAMAGGPKRGYWQKPPPGVIRISENYYYDQTEVANVHWREYLYWTRKVFGEGSAEYQAALPDQSVWSEADSCLSVYADLYLGHPAYEYFPLVGVTKKQAEVFAKWRSDRVMERELVLHHVIEEDTSQNRNKYFTIEKYFTGQYKGIKPDTAFMYYPFYRLPTVAEWREAARLDSLTHKSARSGGQVFDINPCTRADKKTPPTRAVEYIENAKSPDDLYGNIREWVAENNMAAGGSWKDSARAILQQPVVETNGANAWTGFRCVCEWRRWEAARY
ncbi:MAG: SUMF1/EgtB/PvdO family nonheme iron enzyme [Bacteroidetes bacterium]|nr:SUMF1/EgtB/PvdO family nonheme iron enzyme [Bacteroidota bacterium]